MANTGPLTLFQVNNRMKPNLSNGKASSKNFPSAIDMQALKAYLYQCSQKVKLINLIIKSKSRF